METKKRNVILTAKKLFHTKGFNESSVQDIIATCNISKGTFYNYFSSKNEFLIEYLKEARKEEINRRKNIHQSKGKFESDQDIFVKQIIVRLEVKREFTLRPIYEIAYHSDDPLLKEFVENRYIEELTWLAERLVQLYGEKSTPYATDGAILIHGMIQNMLYSLNLLLNNQYELITLVAFIVSQMDYIMQHLVKNKDGFLYKHHFSLLPTSQIKETKGDLVRTLHRLQQAVQPDQGSLSEHIQFLLEEVDNEKPRKYLISTSINVLKENLDEHTIGIDTTEVIHQLNAYLRGLKS